jgi:maleylpyruvate isomerase
VFLIPQLYGARRFGVDLAAFPRLIQVEAACQALASFQQAHADRQPDAVKDAK